VPPRKKSRSRHRPSTITIRVAGILSQGKPLAGSEESVTIPGDRIDHGEVVFRVAGDLPSLGLADHDLLIVERRMNTAATGEVVVAALQGRALIGRWWAKHGLRALMDNEFETIAQAEELVVLGAVTLIVRESSGT
jgi:SOS-response transcriptional repressor LexA